MSYRKFIADKLFTGHKFLTEDEVLITDDKGTIVEITARENAGDGVERYNGILCPGFINCHCHIELSHLKDMIPHRTGMVSFLLTVMNKRDVDKAEIEEAAKAAEEYMWQHGIVAVGDICNTDHSASLKETSKMYYHNFIEATGFIEATAQKRFDDAFEVYTKMVYAGNNNTNSIVPHAPYSVSDALLKLINDFHKETILSIHNQESKAEAEFFESASGAMTELFQKLTIDVTHFKGTKHSSLVHILKQISADHTLLLVHNVHTLQTDLTWIAAQNNLPPLYWCLCPNANLYINDRLPDLKMLIKNGCTIVVGTDSLASNLQLNILEELKTIQQHFLNIPTGSLLQWATFNGAQALQIDHTYGSFEKGKKPGIVHIDAAIEDSLTASVAKKIL
jgi:cytosine/adenosine deaminase-related metal-dependent hydrolase